MTRDSFPQSLDPGQTLLTHLDAVFEQLNPVPDDALLFTLRQQNTEGPVRIHHIFGVGQANRHLASIALGNRLQRWRSIKGPPSRLSDRKSKPHTHGLKINDPADLVRALILFESALQPKTLVAPTHRRPGRMNRASQFASLMDAIPTRMFRQFIDP